MSVSSDEKGDLYRRLVSRLEFSESGIDLNEHVLRPVYDLLFGAAVSLIEAHGLLQLSRELPTRGDIDYDSSTLPKELQLNGRGSVPIEL